MSQPTLEKDAYLLKKCNFLIICDAASLIALMPLGISWYFGNTKDIYFAGVVIFFILKSDFNHYNF
jgi:hypothetical protein